MKQIFWMQVGQTMADGRGSSRPNDDGGEVALVVVCCVAVIVLGLMTLDYVREKRKRREQLRRRRQIRQRREARERRLQSRSTR